MARIYSTIGFGITAEVEPGLWEEVIKEVKFFGNLLRNSFRTDVGDKSNVDTTLNNSISLVGTNFAFEHVANMRYIEFQGTKWVIDSVTIERPRLIIGMGGVYNGPTAPTPNAA